MDNSSFKANVSVVFFVEATIRMFLYSMWGIITVDVVKQALTLMPFMLIGLVFGMLSVKKIDEKKVKKIVIAMLMISGMALIINLRG